MPHISLHFQPISADALNSFMESLPLSEKFAVNCYLNPSIQHIVNYTTISRLSKGFPVLWELHFLTFLIYYGRQISIMKMTAWLLSVSSIVGIVLN